MSRRKQTNPRAIKRDGKFFLRNISIGSLSYLYSASQDEDENLISISKSK